MKELNRWRLRILSYSHVTPASCHLSPTGRSTVNSRVRCARLRPRTYLRCADSACEEALLRTRGKVAAGVSHVCVCMSRGCMQRGEPAARCPHMTSEICRNEIMLFFHTMAAWAGRAAAADASLQDCLPRCWGHLAAGSPRCIHMLDMTSGVAVDTSPLYDLRCRSPTYLGGLGVESRFAQLHHRKTPF